MRERTLYRYARPAPGTSRTSRTSAANINMRATFLAGGKGIGKGRDTPSSIDLAPTLAYLLGIPEPQFSQGGRQDHLG